MCPFKRMVNNLSGQQHYNSKSKLPPLGAMVVLKVGDVEIQALRSEKVIANKNKDMVEYSVDGGIMSGRWEWRYP